jgi:hypothetical protein
MNEGEHAVHRPPGRQGAKDDEQPVEDASQARAQTDREQTLLQGLTPGPDDTNRMQTVDRITEQGIEQNRRDDQAEVLAQCHLR